MRYGQGDTWSIDAGSIGWVDYIDAVTGKVSIRAHGFNGEYVWGTMDPEDLEPGEPPKFTTMTLAHRWEEVPEFNVGDRVRVHSKSIGSDYNVGHVGDATIQEINLPGTRGWRLAVSQIQAPPAGVDPSPDDTIYELEIGGSIYYFLEKDFDKVVESSLKLSWDIVSDELRIPYHSGELVFNFDTMTYYNTELHQSGESSSENPWKFRHTSGGHWEANSKVDPNHWDPLISSVGMRLTEHMFGNDSYLHEASLKLSWEEVPEEPQVGSYVKIIATPEDMEAIGLGYHSWDIIGTTGIVTQVSHGNVEVDAYLYPLDDWQRYMEVVPAPEVPTESSLKLSWEEVPE